MFVKSDLKYTFEYKMAAETGGSGGADVISNDWDKSRKLIVAEIGKVRLFDTPFTFIGFDYFTFFLYI